MAHYYKLIFYVAYRFFINLGRKSDPEVKTVVVLSLWDLFYLFVLHALVKEYWFPELLLPKWLIVAVYLTIALIHFVFLIFNRLHLQIYKAFRKRSAYIHSQGVLIFALYLFTPIALALVFTFTIWR